MKPRQLRSHSNRLLIPMVVLAVPLIVAATYLRIAYMGTERAMSRASYSDLLQAIKRDPLNPRLLYYFGLRNRDLGRIGPARVALSHAAELDPDSEEIALAAADADQEAGSDQQAYQVLSSFLKRHPAGVGTHWALALFYAAHSDPGRAYEEAIAVTERRPRDGKAWRLAGGQALTMRRQLDAENDFRRATALDSRDWRSWYGLGDALENQLRNREALAAYAAAAAVAPDQPTVLARLGRAQLLTAASAPDLRMATATLESAVRRDPQGGLAQLSLGQAQLRAGDYTEAKSSLLKAEALSASLPNDLRSSLHNSLLQLSLRLHDSSGVARETRLLRAAGNYEQTLSRLHTRLITGSLDSADCRRFAVTCAASGDYAESIRLWRRLLADRAYASRARQELAELTRAHAGAEPGFSLSVASAPSGADSAVLLRDAESLLANRQFSQAGDAYQAILKGNPGSGAAWEGLGQALYAQGRREAAFRALSQARRLSPDSPQAQFTLASLYYDEGFPDEAARRIQRLLAASAPKAEYYNALGDCQRSSPLTYAQAEASYRRATDLDPQQPDYLVNLADAETLDNKLPDAETHYRKALEMSPTSAHAQLALGQFLLRRQSTPECQAEAESLLRSALAKQPGSVKASGALGLLLVQRGDASDAVPFLEKAVLPAPTQQDAWYNLARAYKMLHNNYRSQYCYAAFKRVSTLNDAVRNAAESARLHPQSAEAHLKLARLYAQGGANAQALNQYGVCVSLSPNDPAVRTELEKFTDGLKRAGRMPDIGYFNALVAASEKFQR